MKPYQRWAISLLILTTVLIGLGAVEVSAQGGGYTFDWFSIDSGGGQSSGGGYALNGVIGQADAGVLSGGIYVLHGGFLQAVDRQVYLPVVLR
jgi:hypothetical protein